MRGVPGSPLCRSALGSLDKFDEAEDRHPGDLLSVTMPHLQRWMDGEQVRVIDDVQEVEEERYGAGPLRRRRAVD